MKEVPKTLDPVLAFVILELKMVVTNRLYESVSSSLITEGGVKQIRSKKASRSYFICVLDNQ